MQDANAAGVGNAQLNGAAMPPVGEQPQAEPATQGGEIVVEQPKESFKARVVRFVREECALFFTYEEGVMGNVNLEVSTALPWRY